MRNALVTTAEVAGVALIVTGVSFFSIPVALIVAGVALVLIGVIQG